jgi:hypothetical protein
VIFISLEELMKWEIIAVDDIKLRFDILLIVGFCGGFFSAKIVFGVG